ncbi:magnesium/cobalt transporter CorA [Candidatus Nitrosacidococcus sp. I8]|uniref:magnesium/cobalt transporter CorA n=1 Tax=Candidatus Nitrosacidococcus sp. I8 TaxID=2942908 RepID=UPI002225BEC9|nr:magnesium/cobalt transporter CorA [Candidatus Nitrosacidococcus sp. I8]CAH9017577.1 Magnesium transport protein CorA [Candidatus Nitrosacidococcus sp. I8]
MLYGFALHEHRFERLPLEESIASLEQAIWIDLFRPTEEERQQVELIYQQNLPAHNEIEEIEATARFFEDEGGLHLHSYFSHREEGKIDYSTVVFTLSDTRLFTLRDYELPAFRMLRFRVRREPGLITDAASILLALFETKLEELADLLEEIHQGLDKIGKLILEKNEEGSGENLEHALDELARHEDHNGKVRLCLMDTQRALTFLLRRSHLNDDQIRRVREIMRDVDSLLPHSAFLFEKINFLMDAALSFINIEQNRIIKIFSVIAIVFFPPTLIASIYGMNFDIMPEVHWNLGYPIALILMLLSSIAPYLYFKRKGWL